MKLAYDVSISGILDLGNNINVLGDASINGALTATSIVKSGGTSSQFLKADGTIDNSTYVLVSDVSIIKKHVNSSLSTGLLQGGVLSINVDNTKFDIAAGSGHVIDLYTDILNPTVSEVSWDAHIAQILPNLNTDIITHISIDGNGDIIQTTTQPDCTGRRNYIYLGAMVHSNKIIINSAANRPVIGADVGASLQDLMASFGFRSISGNLIGPAGTDMTFTKQLGKAFRSGVNFHTLNTQPHVIWLPELNPATFRYRDQLGIEEADTTLIDPEYWDDNGTKTALVNPNNATIQRVYIFPTGNVRIQRGQYVFANLADALNKAGSEEFTIEPNIEANGLYLGSIVLIKGATDLSDLVDAVFVASSNVSVTGGTTNISSLQQVYDISTIPQIITSSINGELTLKRGSDSDSDKMFAIQNGDASITFNINGLGDVSANSFIKTGGLSTEFLKADGTVDSTEYGSLSYIDGSISAVYSTRKTITQVGHGFSVNDVLTFIGTTYQKARADVVSTAEVLGVVTAVNGDNFTFTMEGYTDKLSGLTPDTLYFLSPTVDGGITATEPTDIGHVSKPVLAAVSTTEAYINNMRGSLITLDQLYRLDTLDDVSISSITDNQALIFDVDSSKWLNETLDVYSQTYIDGSINSILAYQDIQDTSIITALSSSGITDLSINYNGEYVDLLSSSGDDVSILGATIIAAGLVTNTSQTWAGDKIFTGNLDVSSSLPEIRVTNTDPSNGDGARLIDLSFYGLDEDSSIIQQGAIKSYAMSAGFIKETALEFFVNNGNMTPMLRLRGDHNSIEQGSNIASGSYSVAFGHNNIANDYYSFVMGLDSSALGNSSIAMGSGNMSNGTDAITMGLDNTVTSTYGGIGIGTHTVVDGWYGKSIGHGTTANSYRTITLGSYNVDVVGTLNSWVATDELLVVGNGSVVGSKSNALKILKNGETLFSNSVEASALIKTGGTSSEFLKGDGTVDSTSYASLSYVDTSLGDYVKKSGDTMTGNLSIDKDLPIFTLSNTTASDDNLNRLSKINFDGTQSGGEISTLGSLEFVHDGSSDNEAGRFNINVNSSLLGSLAKVFSIGENLGTALGYNNTANGVGSFVAGSTSVASGAVSVVFGYDGDAQGDYSMSLGNSGTTIANYSTTIGLANTTRGTESLAIGDNLESYAANSITIGTNNIIDTGSNTSSYILTDPLFTIGNGNGTQSNALLMLKNGETTFTNTVEASSFIMTGGIAAEFLKANGTVDSTEYASLSYVDGSLAAIDFSDYVAKAGDTMSGHLIIDASLTVNGVFESDNYKTDESKSSIFVGNDTGGTNATWSVYVGDHSGSNNAGNNTIAIGSWSLQSNTGANTIGIGYSTLQSNTGHTTIAIGNYAAQKNTKAYMTAIGGYALQYNRGEQASAFGAFALNRNLGDFNTAFGTYSLRYNEGNQNTALGNYAMETWVNDTANAKVIESLDPATEQVTITNHGFGANGTYRLLLLSTTGTPPSGLDTTTPNHWLIIDANTLDCVTDSFTDVGTGTHTLTPPITYNNVSVIGYEAEPTASNQVMLGNTLVTEVYTYGDITANNGNLNLSSAKISYQENLDVDSAVAEVIASVPIADFDGVFFDYVIKNGTNVRVGIVMAAHDGTNVSYAETTTTDLGDTTDVTLSVDISGADIRLIGTTTSDNWIIKSLLRAI